MRKETPTFGPYFCSELSHFGLHKSSTVRLIKSDSVSKNKVGCLKNGIEMRLDNNIKTKVDFCFSRF